MIIHLIVGLIKKMLLYKMSQHFPKLYKRFGKNIKVELDISNYTAIALI